MTEPLFPDSPPARPTERPRLSKENTNRLLLVGVLAMGLFGVFARFCGPTRPPAATDRTTTSSDLTPEDAKALTDASGGRLDRAEQSNRRGVLNDVRTWLRGDDPPTPGGRPVPVDTVDTDRGGRRDGREVDPAVDAMKQLKLEARLASSAVPLGAEKETQRGSGARGTPNEHQEPADDELGGFLRQAKATLGEMAHPAPAAAPAPAQEGPAPVQPAASKWGEAPAKGLHRLMRGAGIEVATETNVLTVGPVRCQVTANVLAHDLTLVIPKGAKMLGRATMSRGQGEYRLAFDFDSIQFPDGTDYAIEAFPGLAQDGSLGVPGHVNTHAWAMFGAAAVLGAVDGLGQFVGNVGRDSGTTVVVGGIGQSTSQASSQILNRYANREPSINVPIGARLNVEARANLDLPEWRAR